LPGSIFRRGRLACLWRVTILTGFHHGAMPLCWAASVAQLAEQLICNQQVKGSSPFAGSVVALRRMPARGFALTVRSCVPSRAMRATTKGSYPSGQRGQTVNLLASAFVGSNPTLPTFAQLAGQLTFRTAVPWRERRVGFVEGDVERRAIRGCSSMVELLPSKQVTRVRFPSPAPGSVVRESARLAWRLGKREANG
jgi:hypothetical protein